MYMTSSIWCMLQRKMLAQKCIFLGILFAIFCSQALAQNLMIHQKGTAIVDSEDIPIKLRGVNLGGWLLWEPWMWGGYLFASESDVNRRLTEIVGGAAVEKFGASIYHNF